MSFLDYLKDLLGDSLLDGLMSRPTLAYITVKREQILEVSKILENVTKHISTIIGIDTGTYFQLKYHFSIPYEQQQFSLAIEIRIPYDEAQVASIASIYPGASFYELEIQELFGIQFLGAPPRESFLLPDVFPDLYPLRKSVSVEDLVDEDENNPSHNPKDNKKK
ncbi:MAG: NADH-quinone oxidoreductase subunit C [Promethearchaeota archaeon]